MRLKRAAAATVWEEFKREFMGGVLRRPES